jgi:drug/metabolite transporter (DMT)-like permease
MIAVWFPCNWSRHTVLGNDPERRKSHVVGVFCVLASAVLFAAAGTFTRSISANAWTIACWRGLVGAAVIAAYVIFRDRKKGWWQKLRLGAGGWLLAIVGALSSIAFITAFKLTYVANVTVIYGTVTFMAAGLEWLIVGEKAPRRTVATALVSMSGVALMAGYGVKAGAFLGDLFAIAMTVGCALYMVLIRKFRDVPVVWAAAVSSVLLAAASCFASDPLAISARDLWITCGFGISYAFAVILWTEGTMRVTATESGLLGTTELPLAVFFAWLVLSETPPLASLGGGVIVLAAILFHAAHGAGKDRRAVRVQPPAEATLP